MPFFIEITKEILQARRIFEEEIYLSILFPFLLRRFFPFELLFMESLESESLKL